MDGAILRVLNGTAGSFPPLDQLMEALVSDYLVPVFGSLVLVGLWLWGRGAERVANQITVLIATSSVGIANAVTAVVNGHYFRRRPFLDYDLSLLFYEPTDSSFPANTTAVGFALATAVFLRHRKLGGGLYVLAFLWGFARVYAGVHYPSDVLAGAAIGVAATLMMALTYRIGAPLPRLVLAGMRRLYLA